jgi:hypothetical protein
VLTARCATGRHTPAGYLRSTYAADEIDAIAAYAPDTDSCYLIPIQEVAGCKAISLRLAPTRNNQALGVHWGARLRAAYIAHTQLASRLGGRDSR